MSKLEWIRSVQLKLNELSILFNDPSSQEYKRLTFKAMIREMDEILESFARIEQAKELYKSGEYRDEYFESHKGKETIL